jgi:predicted metal-dependent phosphotriesterase family hydrolase
VKQIRTVLGDVDTSSVGIMFAHEHLLMTGDWAVMKEPDWLLNSEDRALEELAPAMKAGLSAMVEMTPLGFGRSPDGLRRISQATGLHIVAATGFHKAVYYSDAHWIHRYTEDQIVQLLVDEIEGGLDEHGLVGPYRQFSEARAGVIKIGTAYHAFGVGVQRLVACVARAALQTGAPIATHNDKGTMGHELLDEFEKHGVEPRRVVLGHVDHNPDAMLLSELASRGAYLALDMPGRIKYAPDSLSVQLFADLVATGCTDRLLLGMDLARRSYWKSLGGGPGLGWLLDRYVPRLRQMGLTEQAEQALTVNAHSAFALRGKS